MDINKIIKLANEFDMKNIRHVFLLVILALPYLIKYIKVLNSTNIEMMFMNEKDSNKKLLAISFILFICLFFTNCFLISFPFYVLIEIFVFVIVLIVYYFAYNSVNKVTLLNQRINKSNNKRVRLLSKLQNVDCCTSELIKKLRRSQAYTKINKKKIKKINEKILINIDKLSLAYSSKGYFSKSSLFTIEYTLIVLLFPIVLSSCVLYTQSIPWISLSLVGTLVETIIVVLIAEDINSDFDIILFNSYKNLFVYRQINDKYLLCGDSNRMAEATKMSVVPLEDIYNQKYYIKRVRHIDNANIQELKDEIDNYSN